MKQACNRRQFLTAGSASILAASAVSLGTPQESELARA